MRGSDEVFGGVFAEYASASQRTTASCACGPGEPTQRRFAGQPPPVRPHGLLGTSNETPIHGAKNQKSDTRKRTLDIMLTANRLEKIMELEDNLRTQYQDKLDAKDKEIEALTAEKDKLKADMQSTIDKQLEQLKALSGKAAVNERAEQQNRELTNRSEKLQAEASELKKRLKTVQREMVEVKEENKKLTQYDPARMRKNLDANKKKLAEKTKAVDALQKSLNQTKRENVTLEQKIKELEAKLAETESEDEVQAQEEQAAA